MSLANLCNFAPYKIVAEKTNDTGAVYLYLDKASTDTKMCFRCGGILGQVRGRYLLRVKHLPIFSRPCYLVFFRYKHHCDKCKKARAERIPFLSEHSPHFTKDYCYWLSRLFEITTIKEASRFVGEDEASLFRLDKKVLEKRLASYKIPEAKFISVDEVCSHTTSKRPGESRNDKFFTVISDLESKKVIWISSSRNKEALDEYFNKIGRQGCKKIVAVATDQHPGYMKSIRQWVPHAKHVLDKFHLMRHFEEAINDTRKFILKIAAPRSELKKLASGRHRFVFLKKAEKRKEDESLHMKQVMNDNELFFKLELIKERMFQFFNRNNTVGQAKQILNDVRIWIFECGFPHLKRWVTNFVGIWPTLSNYFNYPITTSLSEGINNVIKTLKRKAYGYRNLEYFKLKIMQKCGYLSSKYFFDTQHNIYQEQGFPLLSIVS